MYHQLPQQFLPMFHCVVVANRPPLQELFYEKSTCGCYQYNYKYCSMRRAPVDAINPKMISLNLLGIECGCIDQVSFNAIRHMQAKAITQELHKREKEGQVGTSQAPK